MASKVAKTLLKAFIIYSNIEADSKGLAKGLLVYNK